MGRRPASIAPNNRRPASTIVYHIQCFFSLLLTVTLIVSLVQLVQNTSLCPDRQPTLGPRPAGPLLARDRWNDDSENEVIISVIHQSKIAKHQKIMFVRFAKK